MNPSLLFRFVGALVCFWTFGSCKSDDPMADGSTFSIAQIRALRPEVPPERIRITDAGMEGTFRLDPTDSVSTDNTGTTLVTASGLRYKREFTGPASAAWFGVLPTDPDIGPELQAAINAADEVVIPDGAYTQRTTVLLRSNLTLRANPGKVLLTLPDTYVSLIYLFRAQDATTPLRNLRIDGLSWRTTSQKPGTFATVYIDGPSVANFTIQNCGNDNLAARDSTNWLTVKIQAGKTGEDITVRNNTVQAKRMGCEIFNHDNYNVYAGKRIRVIDNVFFDCRFGISLSGPLDDLTVDNNHLKNCSLYGIEIAGAARNVKIRNNRFEGVFDKFLAGTNDGNGNGSVVGGMLIADNTTVGLCTGGVFLANGGAVTFTRNKFDMTGMLELVHSTRGGMFTENTIESRFNKAIICDNTPNHTFSRNVISNKNSTDNHATFLAYGSRATNNVLTNNVLSKGPGGSYYASGLGGSFRASMNYDAAGNLLP